jgi:hypothetical protein
MENHYETLLDKLSAVMRRLQVVARISPNSIENTIFKEYEKAFRIVRVKGDMKNIRLEGLAKAYVDSKGDYSNSLLDDMGEAEKALNIVKEQTLK